MHGGAVAGQNHCVQHREIAGYSRRVNDAKHIPVERSTMAEQDDADRDGYRHCDHPYGERHEQSKVAAHPCPP